MDLISEFGYIPIKLVFQLYSAEHTNNNSQFSLLVGSAPLPLWPACWVELQLPVTLKILSCHSNISLMKIFPLQFLVHSSFKVLPR